MAFSKHEHAEGSFPRSFVVRFPCPVVDVKKAGSRWGSCRSPASEGRHPFLPNEAPPGSCNRLALVAEPPTSAHLCPHPPPTHSPTPMGNVRLRSKHGLPRKSGVRPVSRQRPPSGRERRRRTSGATGPCCARHVRFFFKP